MVAQEGVGVRQRVSAQDIDVCFFADNPYPFDEPNVESADLNIKGRSFGVAVHMYDISKHVAAIRQG